MAEIDIQIVDLQSRIKIKEMKLQLLKKKLARLLNQKQASTSVLTGELISQKTPKQKESIPTGLVAKIQKSKLKLSARKSIREFQSQKISIPTRMVEIIKKSILKLSVLKNIRVFKAQKPGMKNVLKKTSVTK